jgi:transposase-like protein
MTEDQAREVLESIRWPNGIVCPKCGSDKGAYKLTPKAESKKPAREGVYKCKVCRKQFTVTVGTVMERSKIALTDWLYAFHRMCSSKKGISAHQLHRELEISYEAAWFMAHRIRYSMTQEPMAGLLSGTVEADEMYVGGKESNKHKSKRTEGTQGRSTKTKTPVAVLVEREGKVRAKKVKSTDSKTLKGNIRENVDKSARVMTDEWQAYNGLDKEFASHETVDHGKEEYVRGDVYTNNAESFIALFKRGIVGAFHHVSEEHMDRYLNEFAFRWDHRKVTDGARTVSALKGIEGKRLMYKEPIEKE